MSRGGGFVDTGARTGGGTHSRCQHLKGVVSSLFSAKLLLTAKLGHSHPALCAPAPGARASLSKARPLVGRKHTAAPW